MLKCVYLYLSLYCFWRLSERFFIYLSRSRHDYLIFHMCFRALLGAVVRFIFQIFLVARCLNCNILFYCCITKFFYVLVLQMFFSQKSGLFLYFFCYWGHRLCINNALYLVAKFIILCVFYLIEFYEYWQMFSRVVY